MEVYRFSLENPNEQCRTWTKKTTMSKSQLFLVSFKRKNTKIMRQYATKIEKEEEKKQI